MLSLCGTNSNDTKGNLWKEEKQNKQIQKSPDFDLSASIISGTSVLRDVWVQEPAVNCTR